MNEVVQENGVKAAQYAADAIRTMIFDGRLAPGQRLIETTLREEIPVGRSTMREAFLKLEADGLVEIAHQRGARVKRLTKQSLRELFELRECLEGYAARLAAERYEQRGYAAWLQDARAAWLEEEVLADALTHMENNVPLHETIVAIGGNAMLAETLKPLQIPGYRLQFLKLFDATERAVSAQEHVAIIDAIVAGKGAQAEKLMRAHVRRAARLAEQIPGLG